MRERERERERQRHRERDRDRERDLKFLKIILIYTQLILTFSE
jgi:hypothetical protein